MTRPPTHDNADASGSGFDSLVGQRSVIAALHHAIAHERLPHALLFEGPPGVGKATTAAVLARAINCTTSGPRDACGQCTSCSKILRNIHPDVITIAPSPRTIGIDPIRRASQAIGYAPHEGRRRVFIVDDAHTMTLPAQNAFLKTLEEPPASSIIVLVTAAPRGLLATVRSRCQSLRFSPVPLDVARRHLCTAHAMSSEEARLRTSLAPGSIGRALSLDLDAYSELLETVVEGLRMAQRGGAGIVAAADSLASVGIGETATQRAASTLRVARDILRDLLVLAAGADHRSLVNADRLEAWQAWVADLDADALARALHETQLGIERFEGGIPPNVKLALEQSFIHVSRELATRGSTP